MARNQIIGALALLVDDADRAFTADEQRVAQTIASQVATAIDTVRLMDEVRQQRDVAEALRRTATALQPQPGPAKRIGCDPRTTGPGLCLRRRGGGARRRRTVGNGGGQRAKRGQFSGRRIPIHSCCASITVLRQRQPLLVEDTHTCTETVCCTDEALDPGWLGVPLISSNGVIGVLSLDGTHANNFSQAQAGLLTTFADQAAIAVVNARLYARRRSLPWPASVIVSPATCTTP